MNRRYNQRGFALLASLSTVAALVTAGPQAYRVALAQDKPETLEPINPDRPDFTNSPDTVAVGHTQLEFGTQFTRSGPHKLTETGGMLRIGLSQKFEARVDMPLYAHSTDPTGTQQGFEDGGLGFKVKLVEGSEKPNWAKPAVGLEVDVALPTGASAFTGRDVQPQAQLLTEWQLGANDSLGTSFGLAYLGQSGSRYGQVIATASWDHDFSPRLGSFIEGFTFVADGRDATSYSGFDTGLQFLVNNNTMLDMIVGLPLTEGSPEYFVGAGLSVRF